jgi:hypothetical protein
MKCAINGGLFVLNRMLLLIACLVSLSACAHHNAVRVDCEGPLRPINRPAPVSSVAPSLPAAPSPEFAVPAGGGGHER